MHSTPPSPFLQRSTHTMCQSGVVDDESCSIGPALVALEIVVMAVSVCSVIVVSVVGISVNSAAATAVVVFVVLAIDSVSLKCASAIDVVVESDVDGKSCTTNTNSKSPLINDVCMHACMCVCVYKG